MTDTWDTANPGQPARPTGSTVGAMISAVSGLILLGVSFLPWVQVKGGLLGVEGGDANAWEQADAGLTIAAVLIGVAVAVASVVIVYLAASTSNPPSRGARLTIGILAIVGSAFIFFLSAGRLGSLNDTPFGQVDIFEPGVGMMLGWLTAAGFLAGGIVEIVKSRVKRVPQSWQAPPPGTWATPPAGAPPVQASDPDAAGWAAPSQPASQPTAKPAPQPAAQAASPPAWHPDPMGRYEYRYWDGTRWTPNVSTGGQTGHDPI